MDFEIAEQLPDSALASQLSQLVCQLEHFPGEVWQRILTGVTPEEPLLLESTTSQPVNCKQLLLVNKLFDIVRGCAACSC